MENYREETSGARRDSTQSDLPELLPKTGESDEVLPNHGAYPWPV